MELNNVTDMDEYLRDHCPKSLPHKLVLELQDINQHKLLDDVIIECKELREYYVKRQGFIISHLGKMIEVDS
jgi:hypothetical protein